MKLKRDEADPSWGGRRGSSQGKSKKRAHRRAQATRKGVLLTQRNRMNAKGGDRHSYGRTLGTKCRGENKEGSEVSRGRRGSRRGGYRGSSRTED